MKILAFAFSLFPAIIHGRELYAVISQQRSGSTFLCYTLNSHPNIRNYQELLRYDPKRISKSVRQQSLIVRGYKGPQWRDILEDLQQQQDYETVGFKWMFNQPNPNYGGVPLQADYESIVKELNQRNVSAVLLERRNPIRRAVSLWSMRHTQEPVHTEDHVEVQAIDVPVSFFKEKIKEFHSSTKIFDFLRKNLKKSYYLTYKDLTQNYMEHLSKIQTFLGVESVPVTSLLEGTHTQKIHIGTMEELVKGWGDIRAELIKSGYSAEVSLSELKNAPVSLYISEM